MLNICRKNKKDRSAQSDVQNKKSLLWSISCLEEGTLAKSSETITVSNSRPLALWTVPTMKSGTKQQTKVELSRGHCQRNYSIWIVLYNKNPRGKLGHSWRFPVKMLFTSSIGTFGLEVGKSKNTQRRTIYMRLLTVTKGVITIR